MVKMQNGANGTHPTGDGVVQPTLWQKVRTYCKYISVEPFVLCWLVPSLIAYIGIENLQLQKACRVNFNNTADVCMNMIDKTINNITCEIVLEKQANLTSVLEAASNSTANITAANYPEYAVTKLEELVCAAEINSQKLDASIITYMGPIESTIALLMILFAAGWSDRRRLRKPCMLLPMIGDLAAWISLLISAIFFDQLPTQFNAVLSKLCPALGGKENLMLMGIFAYLTETTPEADRTFRFGIFSVFVQILPVIFIAMAGELFALLGYVKLFGLCIAINVCGIIYLIFVLKEAKQPNIETEGVDNPAFDKGKLEPIDSQNPNSPQTFEIREPQKATSCLVDFFNPIVAVECWRMIVQKRKFNARNVLLLLLVMYYIAQGPTYGEAALEFLFTRIKLSWSGIEYGPLLAYSSFSSMIGTLILVGGLSKIFKVADALLGFISTVGSAVSRLLTATATSKFMMYASKTADMFASVRGLSIRSMVSFVVEGNEIGKVFSLLAILEVLDNFVSVPVYAIIYEQTVDSWPGAYYIFSFGLLVVTAILFLVTFMFFRRLTQTKEKDAKNTETIVPDEVQITHM